MAAEENFTVRLGEWRRALGWTQDDLAASISRDKSTVSRWEKEKRSMNVDDIKAVAGALGIEPVALFFAPADGDLARAVSRFVSLARTIGPTRAHALLDALGAPTE